MLIGLVDKWLKSIDNGETVGAIFFDLRKAFDAVDHELLLQKLTYYKFENSSLKCNSHSHAQNLHICKFTHGM